MSNIGFTGGVRRSVFPRFAGGCRSHPTKVAVRREKNDVMSAAEKFGKLFKTREFGM